MLLEYYLDLILQTLSGVHLRKTAQNLNKNLASVKELTSAFYFSVCTHFLKHMMLTQSTLHLECAV